MTCYKVYELFRLAFLRAFLGQEPMFSQVEFRPTKGLLVRQYDLRRARSACTATQKVGLATVRNQLTISVSFSDRLTPCWVPVTVNV
jgi:hypothetical protein